VAVTLADAVALPFRAGAAAVVMACMVLPDLDHLPGSVREMARVLRPGGRRAALPKERRYVDRAESEGVSMTFVSAHRPLSAYAVALAQAGLVNPISFHSANGGAPIPSRLYVINGRRLRRRTDVDPRPLAATE
jgi:ubiquinone/menaquinone biosynthesis C-methylase UbiE